MADGLPCSTSATGWVGGLLIAACISTALSAQVSDANPAFACAPRDGVRAPTASVVAEDVLACHHVRHLVRYSGTMRQMLRILHSRPSLSVRLRSADRLHPSRRGQGRIVMAGSTIQTILEFDASLSVRVQQLEAVAHELAHVIEIACLPQLPRVRNLKDLTVLLTARGRSHRQQGTTVVETPFAAQLGSLVASETRGATPQGDLRHLAAEHGLGPPCVATGDGLPPLREARSRMQPERP